MIKQIFKPRDFDGCWHVLSAMTYEDVTAIANAKVTPLLVELARLRKQVKVYEEALEELSEEHIAYDHPSHPPNRALRALAEGGK